MSTLPSKDTVCRQYYYFQALSEKKTVSHKPHVLEIKVQDEQGEEASFSIAVKISQAKIKRRSNITEDLDAVWMTALTPLEILTKRPMSLQEQKVTMQLSPDKHVPANHQGFLVYVETKGGKTEGRQQQRYVLLRKDAIYTLSCITPFIIVSLKLQSRKGDEHTLKFWPEPDLTIRPSPSATDPVSTSPRSLLASPTAPGGLPSTAMAKDNKLDDAASSGKFLSQPYTGQLSQQPQQQPQPQPQQRQQQPQQQPQPMAGSMQAAIQQPTMVHNAQPTRYRVTDMYPAATGNPTQTNPFNMAGVDSAGSSWLLAAMPGANPTAAPGAAGQAGQASAAANTTRLSGELFTKAEDSLWPINNRAYVSASPAGFSSQGQLEEFDKVNWDSTFEGENDAGVDNLWPADIGLNFDLTGPDRYVLNRSGHGSLDASHGSRPHSPRNTPPTDTTTISTTASSSSSSFSTSSLSPQPSSTSQPTKPERRSSFFFNRSTTTKIKLRLPKITTALSSIAHHAHFHSSSANTPVEKQGFGTIPSTTPTTTTNPAESFNHASDKQPMRILTGGWVGPSHEGTFSPKAADSPASSILSPPRKRRQGVGANPDFVLQPTMWNVARATDTVCKAKLLCFTALQLSQCSVVIELGGKVIHRQAAPTHDTGDILITPREETGEVGNEGSVVDLTPRGSDGIITMRNSAGLLEMRSSQGSQGFLASPMRSSQLLVVQEGNDGEVGDEKEEKAHNMLGQMWNENPEHVPHVKLEPATDDRIIRDMSGGLEAMSLENTPRGVPGGASSGHNSKSGSLTNLPFLSEKHDKRRSPRISGGAGPFSPMLTGHISFGDAIPLGDVGELTRAAHLQPAAQPPTGAGVEWMHMSSDMQS
eukprot:g71487.t1